jgi:3D (Asp-Asp-Asp) domain-containing protein
MNSHWGSAVVVDPRELERLTRDNGRLRAAGTRWRRMATALLAVSVVSVFLASTESSRRLAVARDLERSRTHLEASAVALATLAQTHRHILTATQEVPSVGTRSWGRRFTVTRYLPRSPEYGRFNDGLTATLVKADPSDRIVAVDPKVIPYHSRVWIEGLGWFRAEDCGAAIKGFRLDLLTATREEARTFGRQERFVIVVPPSEGSPTGA